LKKIRSYKVSSKVSTFVRKRFHPKILKCQKVSYQEKKTRKSATLSKCIDLLKRLAAMWKIGKFFRNDIWKKKWNFFLSSIKLFIHSNIKNYFSLEIHFQLNPKTIFIIFFIELRAKWHKPVSQASVVNFISSSETIFAWPFHRLKYGNQIDTRTFHKWFSLIFYRDFKKLLIKIFGLDLQKIFIIFL
jgi:hypothetical protein